MKRGTHPKALLVAGTKAEADATTAAKQKAVFMVEHKNNNLPRKDCVSTEACSDNSVRTNVTGTHISAPSTTSCTHVRE